MSNISKCFISLMCLVVLHLKCLLLLVKALLVSLATQQSRCFAGQAAKGDLADVKCQDHRLCLRW